MKTGVRLSPKQRFWKIGGPVIGGIIIGFLAGFIMWIIGGHFKF